MTGNITPNPSNPLKIPQNAQELINYYRQAPHKGAQIEMFFAFAENYPQIAIPAFCSILENNADLPMRTLAIQSFARIAGKYPQIRQDIEVLRYLANEAKGQGKVTSDLTRWAGAWALEAVGFPEDAIAHLDGGAMTEKPYRIRNDIIHRKLQEIDRIKRIDFRGEPTVEYERFLEFFIYDTEATQELFKATIFSIKYEVIITDVIDQLNVRGVELALDNQNDSKPQIAMTAFSIAGRLFLESSNEDEQKRLISAISRFLNNDFNSNIPLRKKAAEAILNAGNCLHSYLRARALVICEKWDEVISLGEAAVKTLDDILERNLLLSNKENEIINHQIENEIINHQIKALVTIDKINFNQFNDKENLLTRALLYQPDELKIRSAQLLQKYQPQLNHELINLINCILYQYATDEFNLPNATIQKMETARQKSEKDRSYIENIFNQALNYATTLANQHQKPDNFLKRFLNNKKSECVNKINDWIAQLDKQNQKALELQNQEALKLRNLRIKLTENQQTLNKALNKISKIDQELSHAIGTLPNKNIGQLSFNQCEEYSEILNQSKNKVNQYINKRVADLEKISNTQESICKYLLFLGLFLIISTILLINLPFGFYSTISAILFVLLSATTISTLTLSNSANNSDDGVGCLFGIMLVIICIIPGVLKKQLTAIISALPSYQIWVYLVAIFILGSGVFLFKNYLSIRYKIQQLNTISQKLLQDWRDTYESTISFLF